MNTYNSGKELNKTPNRNEILRDLTNLVADRGSVCADEPMAKHTTFRAGGAADYFVTADSSCLRPVLRFLKSGHIPFVILGNGSNVLVSDAGYHGAVIHLHEGTDIRIQDNTLTCGAGERLSVVAHAALEQGCDGLVFAAGIPGTIGGALVMNAGAFGGEMKDIVQSVTALDLQNEEIPELTLTNAEMAFSYRHSIASKRSLCFTSAMLKLTPGDKEDIAARMQDISRMRTEKQPLNYPSAGSTFKRPEGFFAGKLIMEAGLKGYSVGGAQVSEKHCGFVINRGGATAADIYTLIKEVQKKVFEQSGVALEREVILLGEFEH